MLYAFILVFLPKALFAQLETCVWQIERLTHPHKLVIPVFGDAHGNIEAYFRALQSLQRQNGVVYPLALQVGDLGYWPNADDIELRERRGYGPRYAGGVNRFLDDPNIHSSYFVDPDGDRRLQVKLVETWGNHDDITSLHARARGQNASVLPVDDYDVLHWVQDAGDFRIELGDSGQQFRFSALGGVDIQTRPGLDPRLVVRPEAIDALLGRAGQVDVLLTHQGPSAAIKGSQEIETIVELVDPQIHIHGHSHHTSENQIGNTQSIGLGRVPAESTPSPSPEFMGFLECYLDGRLRWSCDFRHGDAEGVTGGGQ